MSNQKCFFCLHSSSGYIYMCNLYYCKVDLLKLIVCYSIYCRTSKNMNGKHLIYHTRGVSLQDYPWLHHVQAI